VLVFVATAVAAACALVSIAFGLAHR